MSESNNTPEREEETTRKKKRNVCDREKSEERGGQEKTKAKGPRARDRKKGTHPTKSKGKKPQQQRRRQRRNNTSFVLCALCSFFVRRRSRHIESSIRVTWAAPKRIDMGRASRCGAVFLHTSVFGDEERRDVSVDGRQATSERQGTGGERPRLLLASMDRARFDHRVGTGRLVATDRARAFGGVAGNWVAVIGYSACWAVVGGWPAAARPRNGRLPPLAR